MALTARDIQEIEKAHPEGLSSRQILEVLDRHGARLSEATLRKYVQLGLLPRSRRVGQKGKHRGSLGIYPVEVIRRVDEIRRAMGDGETLEELARAAQALRAKLSSVRVAMEEAMGAVQLDLSSSELERRERRRLEGELNVLRRSSKAWIKAMEQLSLQLAAAKRVEPKAKRPGANGAMHVARPAPRAAARATKKAPARRIGRAATGEGERAATRSRRRGGD